LTNRFKYIFLIITFIFIASFILIYFLFRPITVYIDGKQVNVNEVEIWAEVSRPGLYHLFIDVSSPDIPKGSDFIISATRTGKDCSIGANFITYRPKNDTQFMPKRLRNSECELMINEYPKEANGFFRGSFKERLYGINSPDSRVKTVNLTFNVMRSKDIMRDPNNFLNVMKSVWYSLIRQ